MHKTLAASAALAVLALAQPALAGPGECPSAPLSAMADDWVFFQYKNDGPARYKTFQCRNGRAGAIVTLQKTNFTQFFVIDSGHTKITSEYYDYCSAARDYCGG